MGPEVNFVMDLAGGKGHLGGCLNGNLMAIPEVFFQLFQP